MSEEPFVLAAAAAEDIRELWDFIAADNVDAADKVVGELFEAMELLATRPEMGHVRSDLAPEVLRFWRVYTYLIVYRPTTRPLEIVRVLSGYRDLPSILATGLE